MHIFIEMKTASNEICNELPHAHQIMAEFANSYERISPQLKEGKVEGIEFFIQEMVERGNGYLNDFGDKIISECKRGSYTRWRLALQCLTGLSFEIGKGRPLPPKPVQNVYYSIDRRISELDLILEKDSNYKPYREIN